MTFSTAIRTCFSKYATFSGRAARPEFWYFILFIIIVDLIAAVIDWQFFTSVITETTDTTTTVTATSNQPVQSLFALAIALPYFTVAFRRMHDTGRSGLYALLPMLLSGGAVLILIFGIGIADLFASGGNLDILFTRLTLLVVIPTLLVLLVSPLLVLWWLTRPSQPGSNTYGPNPHEVPS